MEKADIFRKGLKYFVAGCYTLTILPFTVNFFKKIAVLPGDNVKLFNLVSLNDAHNFIAPLFLAIFEFNSLNFACNFWLKSSTKMRAFILALFFLCQSYPVTAFYYDLRISDYRTKNAADEEIIKAKSDLIGKSQFRISNEKKESFDAEKSSINRIYEQIGNKSNELVQLRREIQVMNSGIVELLGTGTGSPNSFNQMAEAEETRRIRQKLEKEVDVIMKDRQRLEAERERLESDLRTKIEAQRRKIENLENEQKSTEHEFKSFVESQSERAKFRSEMAYIVGSFFTKESISGFWVSLLFPISVLTIGFFLAKPSSEQSLTPSFQLTDYLEHADFLPKEAHSDYVRSLLPAVRAYFTGLKMSGTFANETLALHHQNRGQIQLLKTSAAWEDEIRSTQLAEEAQNILIKEIRSLNKLIAKEE